jgi:hypothetical protein
MSLWKFTTRQFSGPKTQDQIPGTLMWALHPCVSEVVPQCR